MKRLFAAILCVTGCALWGQGVRYGVRLSFLDNLDTDPSEALWRIRISSFGFRIFLRERYLCPYWTKVQ